MLRIIAGDYKGRRLVAPDGDKTRPTTDRVRESLVSSVLSYLGDCGDVRMLDAFAGTGAFGLEMLSRGVAHCTFFEMDRDALTALNRNIATCGVERDRHRVVKGDVLKTFSRGGGGAYHLVFLDPPYAMDMQQVRGFLDDLAKAGCLEPEALVVYEHYTTLEEKNNRPAQRRHAEVGPTELEQCFSDAFEVQDTKGYGKTSVTLMTWKG